MFASRPVVHPVEVEVELAADPAQPPPPPPPEHPQQPHGVLMKDLPGTPGTPVALGLRVAQLFFGVVALSVMASTGDFMTVTAFCIFVAAIVFQCVWSLSMAIVDLYALLVKRCLRNRRAVSVFAVGDLITAGITLGAACGSAGITVLIDDDLYMCSENHCASFESANAMAFLCWFASAPCVILNLRSMASGDRI